MSNTFAHFVFVDFENVPEVDLGLVVGKPGHVTLLIGKNQKKLELPLVRQIHQLANQIELIEVGAAGHNALDITLAYYFGRAAERVPGAQFWIVSKDGDFDAMISHVRAKGINLARHATIAALPFLFPPRKKTTAPFPLMTKVVLPGKSAIPVSPSVQAKPEDVDERLDKLIALLTNKKAPRPKTKTRLLARINNDFGGKLTETQQNDILDKLKRRGFLTIDPKGKVSYP